MDSLYTWIINEIKNNSFAERNGNYFRALNYTRKFFPEFTEFLRIPGVKLDNNSVERGTKTPVLQRNNSRKYLTRNGAHVGDLFMSIMSTAILNKINCVEYLEFCITHRNILKEDPELFLPWNYLGTKKEIEEERKLERPYKIASQRNAFDPQDELFVTQ
jgi:transposase